MFSRRIVSIGIVLCLLLTGVAAFASIEGGGPLRVASSRIHAERLMRLERVRVGGVTNTTVASTDALEAALASARGGDTISLAPGVYSGFSAKYLSLSFETPVIIRSADPSNPAVFTDFRLNDVKGLTFSQLDFNATAGHFSFEVRNSEDIHFERVHFHGSLDGDSSNDPSGLGFSNSKNIRITDSEFQQLERGVAISKTNGILISGTKFHDLRSDGVDFAQVGDVQITNNLFRDFKPNSRDHPDAIQFWTSGTTEPSHDIVISGNVILKGDGAYTQGIFLRDQIGTLPFERVLISENLIVGTGYNGIRVIGSKELTVSGNQLVSEKGQNNTFMLVQKSVDVVATGNAAVSISFKDVEGLDSRGNRQSGPVSDLAGAIQEWMQDHEAHAARLSPLFTGTSLDLTGLGVSSTDGDVVLPDMSVLGELAIGHGFWSGMLL